MSGLSRVSDQGGTPEPLTRLTAGSEFAHYWPQFLDDNTLLFTSAKRQQFDTASIEAVTLDTRARKTVVERAYGQQISGDHIYFTRGGIAFRAAFNRKTLEAGDPEPVLDGVRSDTWGPLELALSRSGTLAYVPGSPAPARQRLVMLDSAGKPQDLDMIPGTTLSAPAVSPDGNRLAYALGLGDADIWIYDFQTRGFTRLTHGGENTDPSWSPDGSSVVFISITPGGSRVMVAAASGAAAATQLYAGGAIVRTGFTADGKSVIVGEYDPQSVFDLWRIAVHGDHRREAVLKTATFEMEPTAHPNGRWLAYTSTESGPFEIYVGTMDGSRKWRVSTGGGVFPVWSRSGRELYYRKGRRLMVVSVGEGANVETGPPRPLFDLPGDRYDVARDGKFVSTQAPPADPSRAIRVVLSWRPAPIK